LARLSAVANARRNEWKPTGSTRARADEELALARRVVLFLLLDDAKGDLEVPPEPIGEAVLPPVLPCPLAAPDGEDRAFGRLL
jgi:hypothetical protein